MSLETADTVSKIMLTVSGDGQLMVHTDLAS